MKKCPLCLKGRLIAKSDIDFKGNKTYYSLCTQCGCEIADAKQMRRSKDERMARRINGV